MNIKEIEKEAENIKKQMGGTIFAFPIEADNPLSKYAVVTMVSNNVSVFPKECSVEEAALGILEILKGYKKVGYDADYEKNVRFLSFQPQMDAPSVTMRRLKKDLNQKPFFQTEKDVIQNGDDYSFTARGIIKMSYLSMVEDKLPKPKQFMTEYYKLLSMRKYGKSITGINKEVNRMSKDEANQWIERTYKQYIHDDKEILSLMELIKKT